MGLLDKVWKRLTKTRALKFSSGDLETKFFESVYRVTYISGFSSSEQKISYFIYSNSLKLLIILLISCELWYLFINIYMLDRVVDSVNIIIIQCSAMYKYMKLIANKDNFKNLASSMESPYFDLSSSKRKEMLVMWQKRNELYLRIILGFGTGTLIAWHTYPLVDDLEYNLMIPVQFPFEFRSSFLYPLTYVAVLIIFSYEAYFVMVNDLIMQAHVMHLLCQFDVLNDCFRNILRDCSEEGEKFHLLSHSILFMTDDFKRKYIKKLDDLIKQHQRILNNVIMLRTILSGPMLAQMAVSTTLISFIGYQVATNTENYTKSLMGLLYLGYNMSVLYIICRWCEELKTQFQGARKNFCTVIVGKLEDGLTDGKRLPLPLNVCYIRSIADALLNKILASENIGEAVYCSSWERGITSIYGVRSRLILVIARANKPLVLTAGGMYELSLASYSNIIKTSYSALTVLLRFRHSHD